MCTLKSNSPTGDLKKKSHFFSYIRLLPSLKNKKNFVGGPSRLLCANNNSLLPLSFSFLPPVLWSKFMEYTNAIIDEPSQDSRSNNFFLCDLNSQLLKQSSSLSRHLYDENQLRTVKLLTLLFFLSFVDFYLLGERRSFYLSHRKCIGELFFFFPFVELLIGPFQLHKHKW